MKEQIAKALRFTSALYCEGLFVCSATHKDKSLAVSTVEEQIRETCRRDGRSQPDPPRADQEGGLPKSRAGQGIIIPPPAHLNRHVRTASLSDMYRVLPPPAFLDPSEAEREKWALKLAEVIND